MAGQEPSSARSFSSASNPKEVVQEESYQSIYQRLLKQVTTLPRTDSGTILGPLYHYNGWYGPATFVAGTMVAQKYFKARPTDVLIATMPKSGTTWIKALVFATVNRGSDDVDYRRLLASRNPHECCRFLEFDIYSKGKQIIPDLEKLPEPRLFATHAPCQSLPASEMDSGCRVVCLSRNPKDNFLSAWHFRNKARARASMEPQPLEEAFDLFCKGFTVCGPYWEHVAGYWKLHLERPQQVLFLKYEELKKEPVAQLKRLAEFLGSPFSAEEEEDGVVDGILGLCDFKSMSRLEVNKVGTSDIGEVKMVNRHFFRRGEVEDWRNHLTPEMADRMDEITDHKFGGTGLSF